MYQASCPAQVPIAIGANQNGRKTKSSHKNESFYRTQRRNRTGTVSYRCLRPTRLPVPPAGHFLSTMRDILKESLRDKHNKILIIYRIQTLNLFKLSRIRIRYFCRYHISLTFKRILFESAPSN